MRQNIITIITPIKPGCESALRGYLRNEIEPNCPEGSMEVSCKKDMRFDELKNLHFADFVILGEDQEIDPCLVFEATVDGEIGDFLNAFIAVAGVGLDHIYRYCQGYPKTGHTLPHLVRRYLKDHDVGYNTFYSGHPGRTVAEILGENELRLEILKYVDKHRDQPGALAPSLRGIQRQIQRFVVRQEPEGTEPSESSNYRSPNEPTQPDGPDLRWAEEVVDVPFAVKYGRILIISLGLAALAVVAWILLSRSGVSTGGLIDCFRDAEVLRRSCPSTFDTISLPNLVGVVVTYPFHIIAWLSEALPRLRGWIPDPATFGFFINIVLLFLTWLVFRILHFLFSLWENSGTAGITWVLWGAVRIAIIAFQWLGLAILIGLAIIILPTLTAVVKGAETDVISYGLLTSLVVLGAAWLAVRYLKTLPRLAEEHPHATVVWRGLKKLVIDLLQVIMLVPIWFAVLVVVSWVPHFGGLLNFAASGAGWLLLMLACAFLVLVALFLIGLAWLLSIYAREIGLDRWYYVPAKNLTDYPVGSESFEREGRGINKVQNHLVSLSYIKPLRRLRLRIVLFLINLECRWWYNRGDLGGVPDIHFLRWIIIDKGRRLLFLDSYHGSWENYLSAFVDGFVVKGMNAIWSHTYVKSKIVPGNVGFPLTACLLWRGARDERPFKEIVRTSQQETLVWYSAYPSLSGINIITNSAIRDALFQDLDTAALDALAQRLR